MTATTSVKNLTIPAFDSTNTSLVDFQRYIDDVRSSFEKEGLKYSSELTFAALENIDEKEFLTQAVLAGLSYRAPEKIDVPVYKALLEKEIDAVYDAGATRYVLLLSDLIHFFRKKGTVTFTPSRGSFSLIDFCLGLSEVDPIRYGALSLN